MSAGLLRAVAPYLIGVGVLVLVAGGGYWKGWTDRGARAERDAALIEVAAAEAGKKAREAAADAIAGIEIKHQTINRTVQREVVEKPVYRECRHSPDTWRAIQEATTP